MRNRLGDIEEEDDGGGDILLSNEKWERLKPILSPAFILITNVDDAWDSPAFSTPNDDLMSRSRSNSLASNSTLRGGRFRKSRHNANDFNIGEHVTFRHKVGVLF